MKTKLTIAAAFAAAIWIAPAQAQEKHSWTWEQVAPTQAESQAFRKQHVEWAVANRWLETEWDHFLGPRLNNAAMVLLYDHKCGGTPFDAVHQAALWLTAFPDYSDQWHALDFARWSYERSSDKAYWCERIGLRIKVGADPIPSRGLP
jgi:hypothetical protein